MPSKLLNWSQREFKTTTVGPTSDTKPNAIPAARPSRKRARVSRPGFLDTTAVVAEESSSDEVETGRGRGKKQLNQRHRRPEPPPLSRHPDDQVLTRPEASKIPADDTPSQITLRFEVPPDHRGPFVVHLNLDQLGIKPIRLPVASSVENAAPGNVLTRSGASRVKSSHRLAPSFTSLPPEIRSMIYRYVFTRDRHVAFSRPENFSRSSQFLRTCKMVASEGASILYMENEFTLDRERKTRGYFWEPTWYEVGYADCRIFLHSIGANIAHIRHLTICFQDGATSYPRHGHGYTENPSGRFTTDEQLLDCLEIIARYCTLRTFAMRFWGRRTVNVNHDDRFLAILKRIKADRIEFCPINPRIAFAARDYLTQRMMRKLPMFDGP